MALLDLMSLRSVQKLRYFLAGVFPFLVRAPAKDEATLQWLGRFPRLDSMLRRARTSVLGKNAERMASTFVLGTVPDDELDWSKLPRDTASVLRATILIAGLLCVLVPLAMALPWPPLSEEAITGAPGGVVAGWSVVLWLIAFAVGFSCLLAGTGAASRVAFVPSVVLFLFFMLPTIAAAPKSWWSLLLTLQASIAIVFCETRSRHRGRHDTGRGLLTALLASAGTAFATIVALPTSPWYRGRLLASSLAVGIPLGIALWGCGRWLRSRAELRGGEGPVLRLDWVAGTMAALNLVLLVSLAARAGLTAPAGGIQTFSIQMTGYLWPLYYFIGIGVVFKVLRQTKAVHGVFHELVPTAAFIPVAFVFLVIATVVPWVDPILLNPGFPWPGWVNAAADFIYSATTEVWARPIARFTMDTMKWVLLAALGAASWALFRRRLTSGMMAGLFFAVTLAGLAVWEYNFEWMGFARTPRNSALSLFIFSVFVLWLAHKTMLRFLVGASPWWPPAARIAAYGATLLFILLPVHARAALHDRSLTNEIFLYLFFGVINFGLPYYLYMYAARRFKQLPITAHAALGMFCFGAVLSMPLVLGDRIVLAGGSFTAAWAAATAHVSAILQGQPVRNTPAFLPTWWVVARGLLGLGSVLAIGIVTRRRMRGLPLASAAVAFRIVAVAAGLACFSNRTVELPLVPNAVVQLLAPLNPSVTIDIALLARQLAFLLPALMLALVVTEGRSRLGRTGGVATAFAVHIGIMWLWPAHEAWLRSTGALPALVAAGIVVFVLLVSAVRERLDAVLEPVAGADGNVMITAPLLTWGEIRWVSGILLMVCATYSAYTIYAGTMVNRPVAGAVAGVRLPAIWSADSTTTVGGKPVLTGASWTGTRPMLWVEQRPYALDSTRALLQMIAMESAEVLADYAPTKLEQWDQFYPGALALDFTYHKIKGDEDTLLGTTALAPLPGGQALIVTVVYDTGDAVRRWDLARMLQALPR